MIILVIKGKSGERKGMYSYEDVLTYVQEENVKFIRLSFCDVKGKQKSITIMPSELHRAFESGISFDASAIEGFGEESASDLFLYPDASTLSILPWQPAHGKVVRMFCSICYPDGTQFPKDGRYILRQAVQKAAKKGITCYFGVEFEFYLFKTDENGEKTNVPFDHAGYMDMDPEDKCEHVRREICFTLMDMGIQPECAHHEEGPGQNEIDFRYSDAMSAADHAVTFQSVVRTIAMRNGLYADFTPKPLKGYSGNGMHVNISVTSKDGCDYNAAFMAGILDRIEEITYFLNPTENSYQRLGEMKAPRYISWSEGNRSQLVRIPAAKGEYRRMELRSPDPEANPYLSIALLIYAGLDGVERGLVPPSPTTMNFYRVRNEELVEFKTLPSTLDKAREVAKNSAWLKTILPENYLEIL